VKRVHRYKQSLLYIEMKLPKNKSDFLIQGEEKKGQESGMGLNSESSPSAYGVGSSSVLDSNRTGQSRDQVRGDSKSDEKFDIVQYDATLPDSLEDEGLPLLFADPYAEKSSLGINNKEDVGKSAGRPKFVQPSFLYEPPSRNRFY